MRKVLQQLLFISAVLIFAISCEKGEEPFPTSINTEKTLVSLPDAANGPLMTLALDLNPGAQTIDILTLKRDAVNAGELNKPLTVKVKLQNALIADPSSGAVNELPRNIYTSHPDNPFDGQYWTVTFPKGEFLTTLKIILDPANLITLTQRVGLGFQLAEAQGAQISDSKGQLGVEISAKNEWDGIYKVYGTFLHPANADLTGDFGTPSSGGDVECALYTTGSNTLNRDYGAPIGESVLVYNHVSNVFTYFTGVKSRFRVNANNSVTVSEAPGTIAFDPTPNNCSYNPATKTFTLNYGWTSTGGQRVITEYLVYLRPR
jgi:hypothetical protein